MERCERAVGLVYDELKTWRYDIEETVRDESVSENLKMKMRETGNGMSEAIKVYVDEAWESMGPSFFDVLVENVSDDAMREVLGEDQVAMAGGDLVVRTKHEVLEALTTSVSELQTPREKNESPKTPRRPGGRGRSGVKRKKKL